MRPASTAPSHPRLKAALQARSLTAWYRGSGAQVLPHSQRRVQSCACPALSPHLRCPVTGRKRIWLRGWAIKAVSRASRRAARVCRRRRRHLWRAPARIDGRRGGSDRRSEEHTSELQSLMRHSYAVFCLKKKKKILTTKKKNTTKKKHKTHNSKI